MLILIVVVYSAHITSAGVVSVINPVTAFTLMFAFAVASLFVIEYTRLPQNAANLLKGILI